MAVQVAEQPEIADPAPLGLGGFALTTFVLSLFNANWAPNLAWVGFALFYGGLAQFLAGMWEFRNRNTFGSTAFASYGAFWLSLATLFFMQLAHVATFTSMLTFNSVLGWFLVAFSIFNLYMLLWSTRVSKAVFAVFLTLQFTEVVLFCGLFSITGGHMRIGTDLVHVGGYLGIVTAACAWYASAAGVVNSMARHSVVPTGAPMWTDRPEFAAGEERVGPGRVE